MAGRSKSLDPRTLRSEISDLRAAGSLVSARAFRNRRSISTEACATASLVSQLPCVSVWGVSTGSLYRVRNVIGRHRDDNFLAV